MRWATSGVYCARQCSGSSPTLTARLSPCDSVLSDESRSIMSLLTWPASRLVQTLRSRHASSWSPRAHRKRDRQALRHRRGDFRRRGVLDRVAAEPQRPWIHGCGALIANTCRGSDVFISKTMPAARCRRCRIDLVSSIVSRIPNWSAENVVTFIRTIYARLGAGKHTLFPSGRGLLQTQRYAGSGDSLGGTGRYDHR